jgi:Tfp pilus assembly PilM family ATPase
MATRLDSVCGIDITKDSISIAQYSAADNTVANASIVPLDDADSAADLISSLKAKFRKVASQMHCEGQAAAVAMSANSAVVKILMLDADEKDVREAIGWELGQHIVGTMDDYSFDYEPLAAAGGSVRRFLAVAYRSANVQKLVSLLKSARISPFVVDLDIFALIDVFEANYRENIASPAVIVHGCGDSSRLVLTEGGAFLDFDVVEHRGGHAAADAYASQLQDAMGRSFAGTNAGFETYVTGPLFSDPDFSESVCSRLGSARVLDPFKAVRSTVAIPSEELVKCIPYLAVAVGLSLRCAAEADA